MTKRFLIFQHLEVEHPGIFRTFMQEEGIAWDTVELDRNDAIPDLRNYAALIVMGGPMDVWEETQYPWLREEKSAIRHAILDLNLPYLGVCLGHQLLASALGGVVGKSKQSEVGIMDISLTKAGQTSDYFTRMPWVFPSLQWHSAEVRQSPKGAAILAESPVCMIQALGFGPHAFSTQFHLEIIDTTVDDWVSVPAYRESLEKSLGKNELDNFRTAAANHIVNFQQYARTLWDNWRKLTRDEG